MYETSQKIMHCTLWFIFILCYMKECLVSYGLAAHRARKQKECIYYRFMYVCRDGPPLRQKEQIPLI